MCFQQKHQSGVTGRNGLFVVRSAGAEYHTERENVSHQNVHMLTLVTTNVMEMTMKRRNVINNAAQVCILFTICTYLFTVCVLTTEKPYWGVWQDWTVCTKTCGGGISYRKRKCIPSKCPYADPRDNKCNGTDYEEKKCNEHCCPGLLNRII